MPKPNEPVPLDKIIPSGSDGGRVRFGSLTRVTESSSKSGKPEFWLADPERLIGEGNDWGISVHSNMDSALVTFVYPDEDLARAAYGLLAVLLKDCSFIDVDETDGY